MVLPTTISDINGTTHLNGVIIRSTQMIQTATMIMAIFPFPILPQLLTTPEIIMNNFLHTSSSYVGYLIDFQIQGLFGSYNATPSNNQIFPDLGTTYDFVFNGTVSDWSSTQTLTI